jgi:hypothetical protein
VASTTTQQGTDKAKLSSVIDAMREVQSESDRWALAESLRVLIPTGTKPQAFQAVIDEATQAGVAGKLKVNTLRLYRDTAARWPVKSRVAGVSFSAHREAMVMIAADGNTSKAERLLNDAVKAANGADKVTVAQVRKAAALKQGRTTPAQQRGSATPTTTTKGMDVLNDLENGAPQLLAALASVDTSKLDKLHNGLSKALARVEQLRAKAQRAKSSAKAPAAKREPAPAAKQTAASKNGGKSTGSAKRPDMRDVG